LCYHSCHVLIVLLPFLSDLLPFFSELSVALLSKLLAFFSELPVTFFISLAFLSKKLFNRIKLGMNCGI